MIDHSKGTGFWAAVVLCGIVAMPVLYLLLFPAFLYLSTKMSIPDTVFQVVCGPFKLCVATFRWEPEWFWLVYGDYTGLWGFPL